MTNIALDVLGQARVLLSLAAEMDDQGHDEDALAFLRQESDYRNLTLVELPRGDFADTIVRSLLLSVFFMQVWAGLRESAHPQLAALANKAIKETSYHRRHAAEWTVRLGQGTATSHERIQAALDRAWPYTREMFEIDDVDESARAASLGPRCVDMRLAWLEELRSILDEAGLSTPTSTAFRSVGKQGRHSEHLGYLLCEMQYLQRAYPGATW